MPAYDSIDQFEFLQLDGMPDAVKEGVIQRTRAGAAGTKFKRTGRRGQQFTLHSKVDLASFAEWPSVYYGYLGLIGADPVDIVQGGLDFSQTETVFEVVNVRVTDAHACLTGSGGLNAPSFGWLECDWDIVPVELEEE